jgi:predicted dehydrogenase
MGVADITACDPSAEQRNGFQALYPSVVLHDNYETALKSRRFDAVYVLTPPHLHIDMIRRGLDQNCHVFVEKPLAYISNGIEALMELAESRNKKVMVGFCFRYHETLVEAKKLLESGTIGRLVSIRALMGEHFPEVQPNYKNMYYSEYFGAFELVHDLDLALWYAGQSIKEVSCVYGTFSDIDIQSPDTVEFLIQFEDRLTASVHLDFFQRPRRRVMELIATHGVITVDFASWEEAVLSFYTADSRKWMTKTIPTRRDDMFRDENACFLNAVLDGSDISCTMREALKTVKIIERFYKPFSGEHP